MVHRHPERIITRESIGDVACLCSSFPPIPAISALTEVPNRKNVPASIESASDARYRIPREVGAMARCIPRLLKCAKLDGAAFVFSENLDRMLNLRRERFETCDDRMQHFVIF